MCLRVHLFQTEVLEHEPLHQLRQRPQLNTRKLRELHWLWTNVNGSFLEFGHDAHDLFGDILRYIVTHSTLLFNFKLELIY